MPPEGLFHLSLYVWQGKTHRESYYNPDNREDRDASFAVSESGYMDDDELGIYALYVSTLRLSYTN